MTGSGHFLLQWEKGECFSHSPLLHACYFVCWFCLAVSIYQIAALHIDIPLSLDASFFPLDSIEDLLGPLHLSFAKTHLFSHHRLSCVLPTWVKVLKLRVSCGQSGNCLPRLSAFL